MILKKMEIKGKTSLEVWQDVLSYILNNGVEFTDREERTCKEVLNVTATISEMDGITKPIEMLNKFNKWTYPSPDLIRESILGKEDSSEYYYNYGERMTNFNGINQIDDYIIPLLKKNPSSRRAIILFYNPLQDTFLFKKETPGLIMINFNIREGKIHTTMVIRSNDLFHGWPGNIAQAYFLTNYLSNEVNYPIGTITLHSISAHIFKEQFEDIKKVIGGRK